MSTRILGGDCRGLLKTLPDQSVHCCVTSPPYFGLRDYGCDGQLGLEPTPDAYVASMVEVFREVRRVLRDDGTLWLNLGDSYANDTKWGGSVEIAIRVQKAGVDDHLPGLLLAMLGAETAISLTPPSVEAQQQMAA